MMRILPGEDPAEYERVKNGWLAEYGPEGHMEETLANNLIDSEWMLLRARRNRFNAEARAVGQGKEPHEWTAEDSHQIELMQRYLTTAERSFYRAFNAMQGLRKNSMRKDNRIINMELIIETVEAQRDMANVRIQELERSLAQAQARRAEASVAKASNGKPKKPGKIEILDQWVDIEMIDGKTVTTLYPSNEELLEEKKRMTVPPTLVYRRLNFVDGVPPEYRWTTEDPVTIEFGGMATQRIRLETWLELIGMEKASGTGHLHGCEIMPRPEERGGCDCESCTRAKARIAAEGR